MSTFALVMNGKIVQTAAAIFQVNPALAWTPDIGAVSPAPTVGWWSASLSGGAWTDTAPPAPPGPTLAQQATPATLNGQAITSTGTPALNATYDVSDDSQSYAMARDGRSPEQRRRDIRRWHNITDLAGHARHQPSLHDDFG